MSTVSTGSHRVAIRRALILGERIFPAVNLWTAQKSVHWIVSLLGVAIALAGTLVVTQVICVYLPFDYPLTICKGSIRSKRSSKKLFAGAAILFSSQ